jgi:hypothetical protein
LLQTYYMYCSLTVMSNLFTLFLRLSDPSGPESTKGDAWRPPCPASQKLYSHLGTTTPRPWTSPLGGFDARHLDQVMVQVIGREDQGLSDRQPPYDRVPEARIPEDGRVDAQQPFFQSPTLLIPLGEEGVPWKLPGREDRLDRDLDPDSPLQRSSKQKESDPLPTGEGSRSIRSWGLRKRAVHPTLRPDQMLDDVRTGPSTFPGPLVTDFRRKVTDPLQQRGLPRHHPLPWPDQVSFHVAPSQDNVNLAV